MNNFSFLETDNKSVKEANLENVSFIETDNNIIEEVKLEKCCDTPFTTYSSSTNTMKCNLCEKEYTDITEMVYDCSHCDIKDAIANKCLDLRKDDRTDWTTCDTCNKFVNYTFRKRRVYKNITPQ